MNRREFIKNALALAAVAAVGKVAIPAEPDTAENLAKFSTSADELSKGLGAVAKKADETWHSAMRINAERISIGDDDVVLDASGLHVKGYALWGGSDITGIHTVRLTEMPPSLWRGENAKQA